MSGFSATVSVEHLDAANADLVALGHGPCFSLPMAPDAGGATHAGFHAWHDPAFRAAVEALDPAYGVVTRDDAGETPPQQFTALAQGIGIPWPPADDWMDHLPEIGDEHEFDGQTWRNLMAGNPYLPPYGWELIAAPPAPDDPWTEGMAYEVGDRRTYDGRLWECVVAHTAFVGAGWTPPASPSLWTEVG